MELTPEDKKVIDLLSKLKNSNGTYPSDILAARREAYLKQVANVGLGIGISTGLKQATKTGNGGGALATTTITSKILETALIAAIAIEAGAAAYLYRDKLADLIKTYTHSSNVQEVTPSSNNGSSLIPGLIETLGSPSVTITTPSNTPPVTPSGTPGPELSGANNGTNSNVNATPKPGGNNGNQYGLTPKPVRTKDNTNTGGSNNGGGNNNGGNGNNNSGNNNKP